MKHIAFRNMRAVYYCIIFRGHLSNFKVTQAENWRFHAFGWFQQDYLASCSYQIRQIFFGLWCFSVFVCLFVCFFTDAFFSRSNTLLDIRETKRKCIGWIQGQLYELWPHLWPWSWIFKCQILKYLYLRNCLPDWCETKEKQINWIPGVPFTKMV